MIKPIYDYHMHTPLCGHAVGEPQEYVEHAIKMGLEEMGFSDHAPFVHMVDPGVTMGREQLPTYYEMIEDVKNRYKDQIRIKTAIEADFIPGYETKIQEILDDYAYDYVIGSVHFIKDWGFDDPSQRSQWDEQDVNQVYRDYFDLLRQSAQSKMFDIMAHVDLPKKFGNLATKDMTSQMEHTAEVFKQSGMAAELNTSGLRKPCREMYPSFRYMEILASFGVPLTFGSDAHEPEHVGCDFEEGFALAKKSGYKNYVVFEQRKIIDQIDI
jgi:histidinol-phosphatase (PHP family)